MPSISVIGESCLDEFVYCNANRLAPDLPIPILEVVEKTRNPGMAKNVHRNIVGYLPEAVLFTNSNWELNKKTRYVDFKTNHTFLRVDSSADYPSANLDISMFDSDLIVIADYDKGFLNEDQIENICESNPNVFLDTKKILGPWAHKARYIKINDYEYQRSAPFLDPVLSEKIIHTRDKFGCDFQGTNYPVRLVEVGDASGAGDSFMAALVVAYVDTGDILESIKFANEKAALAVSHRGVSTI